MSTRTVVIWRNGSRPRSVDARDTGTPGLVVHLDEDDENTWPDTEGGDPAWTVTHERSGRRISHGLTRFGAFLLAIRLREVADWTLSSKELKSLDIGRVVQELIDDITGGER